MQTKRRFLVFSKYPVTRPADSPLAGTLDGDTITALYLAFLKDAISRFRTLPDVGCGIICLGDEEERFLKEHIPDTTIQSYADDQFSSVLQNAAEEAFNGGAKQVFVFDATAPTVPYRLIESGLELMDVYEESFTIAKTERGGFFAAGMNRPYDGLFNDIEPATPQGYEETIQRICRYDASVYILGTWYDIMDLNDLVRLHSELLHPAGDSSTLPETVKIFDTIPQELLLPSTKTAEG